MSKIKLSESKAISKSVINFSEKYTHSRHEQKVLVVATNPKQSQLNSSMLTVSDVEQSAYCSSVMLLLDTINQVDGEELSQC